MKNLSLVKALVGVAVLAGAGVTVAVLSGAFSFQFSDGGYDVRKTKCEELAFARQAISSELEDRKTAAQNNYNNELDQIGDEYWAENQKLEAKYHQCISKALTADPCKEPFEEVGRLYEEIMADFAADKGFNEAKFNEREEAKKRYNDCVEETHKPEFYKDKETACNAELAMGREANQAERTRKEAEAKSKYDEALARAQDAYQKKSAILDEIEKECNEPGGTTAVGIGSLTTGGSGAVIQSNSSACTGIFAGNDPNIQRQISNIEGQLQKAKAAGERGGLSGIDHLQEALDRLNQELRDSGRSCKVDADCGNPEPVCCSGTQVGRAYCSNGTCASEKIDCVDPEICAGKPAQCIAPGTGAKQQSGVYISRTIPEEGPCSQNLQVLDLQQASPESVRYDIVGNIPDWLNIDKPGGALPNKVNVTYSCGTVQGFGPGVYSVNGSITVKNSEGGLINTIPFNVSITVTGVQKMVDVISVGGKYIPVDQVHRFTGPECDKDEHWHANGGSAEALDGTAVPDTSDCGYGKTKDVPVMSVPDTRSSGKLKGEVRGLEGLKNN